MLGIGSPAGDDRAGWLVVDALLADGRWVSRGIVVEKLDRPGADLISHLENGTWVILIDAMQSGGPAGRIRHFDHTDWAAYPRGLSSHGFGVLDALSLAHALDALPARLDLYGIEVGAVAPGEEPGAAVRSAARRLAGTVAAALASADVHALAATRGRTVGD